VLTFLDGANLAQPSAAPLALCPARKQAHSSVVAAPFANRQFIEIDHFLLSLPISRSNRAPTVFSRASNSASRCARKLAPGQPAVVVDRGQQDASVRSKLISGIQSSGFIACLSSRRPRAVFQAVPGGSRSGRRLCPRHRSSRSS